jgi:chaperonin GroEL (HSP60 family)
MPGRKERWRSSGSSAAVVASAQRALRALGDLVTEGIVDATRVVRCALQNAASIGTLVFTTDAIVVDSGEEKGEGSAEG